MPESQPNQIARVFAVFALIGVFLLVVATIATSGGGSEGGGGDEEPGATKKGKRAIEKGVWVVGRGDTLVSISEETGIEIDELVELNPNLDPQILNTGQRISLRPGGGQAGGSPQGGDQGAAQPGSGTGVGDGGPTGPGSGVSDGIPSN